MTTTADNAPRMNLQAHAPRVYKAMLALDAAAGEGLEPGLKELVRIRASQLNGCVYCIDMHTTDARKGGETDRRLAAVVVWRETPFFTDRERAALEWTEALTLVSHEHVPDAVWEAVHPHFTQEEIVDLTLLVSSINTWNRFAIAFRKMPV